MVRSGVIMKVLKHKSGNAERLLESLDQRRRVSAIFKRSKFDVGRAFS